MPSFKLKIIPEEDYEKSREYEYTETYNKTSSGKISRSQKAAGCYGVIIVFILGALGGFAIGWSLRPCNTPEEIDLLNSLVKDNFKNNDKFKQTIINSVDIDKMKESHRHLSEVPHYAGTERDSYLALWIYNEWSYLGLEDVSLVPYNMLLSYPDNDTRSKVRLWTNGTLTFESQDVENMTDLDDNRYTRSFCPYSPSGEVNGSLVYVNYGRKIDFETLAGLSVDVSGHICFMRIGSGSRGLKLKNCADAGGIGAVLFSDPEDVACEGTNPENVYNNTEWLPGDGMTRGSLLIESIGDPLTPGYPSLDEAYRIPITDAPLPTIPCQVIGYSDAQYFFSVMGGLPAPEGWAGGLPDVSYNVGPEFIQDNIHAQLSVSNVQEQSINYNVIGKLKGFVEPDRWVIIGNHRDAWSFGAMDPSSGTAQLMETARVITSLYAEGWRPRRSILFASWGAEEFGLLGTIEWVEEHMMEILKYTVAYVNTDTCASGDMFTPNASPQLQDMIREVADMVPSPYPGNFTSLYDFWQQYQENLTESVIPPITEAGSISDQAPFTYLAGVPYVHYTFKNFEDGIQRYPMYHTMYDNLDYYTTFIDPDYKYMESCAHMALLTLYYLADSAILPINPVSYAERLSQVVQEFKEGEAKEVLTTEDISLLKFESKVEKFVNVTKLWMELIKLSDYEDNPVTQRMINDKLMHLEKAFLLPEGISGRPYIRNAMFAPSSNDMFSGEYLPGLQDLMYDYHYSDGKDKEAWKQAVEIHITKLMSLTHQANLYYLHRL